MGARSRTTSCPPSKESKKKKKKKKPSPPSCAHIFIRGLFTSLSFPSSSSPLQFRPPLSSSSLSNVLRANSSSLSFSLALHSPSPSLSLSIHYYPLLFSLRLPLSPHCLLDLYIHSYRTHRPEFSSFILHFTLTRINKHNMPKSYTGSVATVNEPPFSQGFRNSQPCHPKQWTRFGPGRSRTLTVRVV